MDILELVKDDTYAQLAAELQLESLSLFNEKVIIHKLSHQHLHTRFWIAEAKDISVARAHLDLERIPIEGLHNYAVPVLIENFISEFSVFKI